MALSVTFSEWERVLYSQPAPQWDGLGPRIMQPNRQGALLPGTLGG